jgi:hypothetical protein
MGGMTDVSIYKTFSAFAFFRVDGIAQQLLTALPVTRIALMRLHNQIDETSFVFFCLPCHSI